MVVGLKVNSLKLLKPVMQNVVILQKSIRPCPPAQKLQDVFIAILAGRTDAKWQAEVSDERLFNSITNRKGKMPAWGKKLFEAQINALVAYGRRLKQ